MLMEKKQEKFYSFALKLKKKRERGVTVSCMLSQKKEKKKKKKEKKKGDKLPKGFNNRSLNHLSQVVKLNYPESVISLIELSWSTN